jgi:hypothetical protein
VFGNASGFVSFKPPSTTLTQIFIPPGPYYLDSNNDTPFTSDIPIAFNRYDDILSDILVTSSPPKTGQTEPVPQFTKSIAYSPLFNEFMIVGEYEGFWIGSTKFKNESVSASGPLQASLPVEYVFLGDDEISLIQKAKIDYVITQLQMHRDFIPPGVTSWPMRLEFINPVKELLFVIQDQLALQTNDYFNFKNISTNLDQLDRLRLDFNGETIISDQIADELYLSILQFMNCHTRVPEIYAYNYSFSIDPENYLPTGQVNMSRIYNKNMYLTTTPNPNARDIRVYAKSYNILRIQNGLAGVLFMDNNFY